MLFGYYALLLFLLVIFSYGFVDPNFPYQPLQFLHEIVFIQRKIAAILYSAIVVLLFAFYGLLLRRIKNKKITSRTVWKLIFLTISILFFSFPAFSNDIFNYIATAKVTYIYRENPYIVMPIEIPNEPMLSFMHAANKTALYGPSWILLTAIPHFAGLGNLILTIFTFKIFVAVFYLGLVWLIWRLSGKDTFALAFFALNPLVVIETLVSAHNDAAMMFFAVLAFYLLRRGKILYSLFFILYSMLIKFTTIFLLPVYIYVIYHKGKDRKINWQKIWFWSASLMFAIFLLSPLREEMYSWYFIWSLTFIVLLRYKTPGVFNFQRQAFYLTLALSFGLLMRFAPFVYTREWGGVTPMVKILATWIPSMLIILHFVIKYAIKKT